MFDNLKRNPLITKDEYYFIEKFAENDTLNDGDIELMTHILTQKHVDKSDVEVVAKKILDKKTEVGDARFKNKEHKRLLYGSEKYIKKVGDYITTFGDYLNKHGDDVYAKPHIERINDVLTYANTLYKKKYSTIIISYNESLNKYVNKVKKTMKTAITQASDAATEATKQKIASEAEAKASEAEAKAADTAAKAAEAEAKAAEAASDTAAKAASAADAKTAADAAAKAADAAAKAAKTAKAAADAAAKAADTSKTASDTAAKAAKTAKAAMKSYNSAISLLQNANKTTTTTTIINNNRLISNAVFTAVNAATEAQKNAKTASDKADAAKTASDKADASKKNAKTASDKAFEAEKNAKTTGQTGQGSSGFMNTFTNLLGLSASNSTTSISTSSNSTTTPPITKTTGQTGQGSSGFMNTFTNLLGLSASNSTTSISTSSNSTTTPPITKTPPPPPTPLTLEILQKCVAQKLYDNILESWDIEFNSKKFSTNNSLKLSTNSCVIDKYVLNDKYQKTLNPSHLYLTDKIEHKLGRQSIHKLATFFAETTAKTNNALDDDQFDKYLEAYIKKHGYNETNFTKIIGVEHLKLDVHIKFTLFADDVTLKIIYAILNTIKSSDFYINNEKHCRYIMDYNKTEYKKLLDKEFLIKLSYHEYMSVIFGYNVIYLNHTVPPIVSNNSDYTSDFINDLEDNLKKYMFKPYFLYIINNLIRYKKHKWLYDDDNKNYKMLFKYVIAHRLYIKAYVGAKINGLYPLYNVIIGFAVDKAHDMLNATVFFNSIPIEFRTSHDYLINKYTYNLNSHDFINSIECNTLATLFSDKGVGNIIVMECGKSNLTSTPFNYSEEAKKVLLYDTKNEQHDKYYNYVINDRKRPIYHILSNSHLRNNLVNVLTVYKYIDDSISLYYLNLFLGGIRYEKSITKVL